MIFAALALLMGLIAAAAVAVPLWRGVQAQAADSDEAAALTRQMQLAELDRDLAVGALAETDYRAARHDMETEWAKTRTAPSIQPSRNRGLAAGTALLLIAISAVLYWRYGNWRAGVEGVEAASVPAVEHMVEELSQRLHGSDQGDLQGWEMLGHAYVIMERYPDALDAYDHARKLSADSNADVLAGYAEALTLANAEQHPEIFMQQALPLFEKALALDPHNPQALWYGGLGAYEQGDKTLAVRRWQALLAQNPPQEYRAVISKYIAEAGGTIEAAGAAAAAPAIRVRVSLAPGLKAKAAPNAALFVFAEAADRAGPPLAVKRYRVGDLPLDVELTDQDAPLPGQSLAGHASLMLTARVSMDGEPTSKPGDLEGRVVWKKTGAQPL